MADADAMRTALDGHIGKMIVFNRISNTSYSISTGLRDIDIIVNKEKMPDNLISSGGVGVTKEFEESLIIGEFYPFMVDGLPKYLELSNKRYTKGTTKIYETFRN